MKATTITVLLVLRCRSPVLVPERFLEAPRVFERERERDRDRDRDRALLAEVFLTERRLTG